MRKVDAGYSDAYQLRNDILEDEQSLVCPLCADEKYSYDEVCYQCERKQKTCPRCGSYKFKWEKICSSCEAAISESGDNYDEEY
jgi:hypothetical protein